MASTKTQKKVVVKKKVKVKAKKVVSKSQKRRLSILKPKGDYLVSIYLNEQVFEGVGNTCLDALNAITIPNQLIKTKVILNMFHGEKKMEQVIIGMQLKRIIGSRVAKEIWAKRLEMKLK